MKVLIITGGNIDDDFAFSFLSDKNYDEIIAVDGGLAFADRVKHRINDFRPTHLVGDFDTIDPVILEQYIHCEDIAVKLALRLVSEHSTSLDEKVLHIIGGTGTRLDHVMANLQMLKNIMESGVQGAIIDSNNYIEMICGLRILNRSEIFGKYLSLIPASMELRGITLDGFKYPLKNARTCFGESLCVSNELISDEGYIEIKEGIAWMILSRD